MSIKKGQELEAIVERVDFPNRGIFYADSRKVTVKDVLQGQKIRCRITKARSGGCEATVLEVLEKAPGEISSDCPHFGQCGGCTLRTLPYELQLQRKEEQVRHLLEPVLQMHGRQWEDVYEGIEPSPVQIGYRNKMEYTFGDAYKDGPMTLGLHKRGSFYDILTTDSCRIADEDFGTILKTILECAVSSGLKYFHRQTHAGYFRHLLLRKGFHTGEILVCLVTSSQADRPSEQKLLEQIAEQLKELSLRGNIVGFVHVVNNDPADAIKCEQMEVLFGRDYYLDTILGLTFQVSLFSFFQNNTCGAELLYEKARSYIGETEGCSVFDLYSGTGTITQLLASAAREATGVEIVEEAVEAAKMNAARNGLKNCRFIAGDVLKVLDELEQKPDLIVLDPPRDGIHPKALMKILSYAVPRMVYISCKPTSLARDLESFYAAGYQVERCAAADLFPGTVHVETVVLLSKR